MQGVGGAADGGAGEDVLLGKLFAAARVRGFQGQSLKADDTMMATVKHFAAYGAAESGLDYNPVEMSERMLREAYLPPYKAGFDAGAMSAMSSFNDINGVPATGNHWLMTDLLRGEWGFRGFVVSDYTSDEEMILAGYAADRRDAAVTSKTLSVEDGRERICPHLPNTFSVRSHARFAVLSPM